MLQFTGRRKPILISGAGKADRAKASATFREIMDAMWLFNEKFARAQAKFAEIRGR